MNSPLVLVMAALTIGSATHFAFGPTVSRSATGNASATLPEFELRDGDRVVFVGNTFAERDQAYGYLETMLTARWQDRTIVFRNLGWSGDTVWGEARARFGSAEDGFQHLKDHIETLKPTVIFVAYGANESFEGEAGLVRFELGLNKLLDMFAAAAAPKAAVILLSPIQQEDVGPPLPNPRRRNEDLKRYANSIQRIAADRDYRFVDLYESLVDAEIASPFGHTENGLHLTASGYWKAAAVIESALGIQHDHCDLTFTRDRRPVGSKGALISNVDVAPQKVRFEMKPSMLPCPLPPRDTQRILKPLSAGRLSLGLPPGNYHLKADGHEIGDIRDRPEYQQVEQLRQAIIEKNRLYFHRWRPQNETYLFGFRKHEQGQNAVEVPKFDPLVEEQERRIAELRVPRGHTYELIRTAD